MTCRKKSFDLVPSLKKIIGLYDILKCNEIEKTYDFTASVWQNTKIIINREFIL